MYPESVLRIADLADVYQGMVRAGRGAGAQHGDWVLRLVESGDLGDDGWLDLKELREVGVVQSTRTERHLLRPLDLLVTARAGSSQLALVPPGVSKTVAGATLLVVRTKRPESGMAHWLWYFLTSARGRAQAIKRMTVSASLTSLTAAGLSGVEVPVPAEGDLHSIARLVEASEAAYTSAVEAARLRRETLRDVLVESIGLGMMGPGAFKAGRDGLKLPEID